MTFPILEKLPQACLALDSTHRHTLNKRMAGWQIHTALLYVEFHSVCSSVLYEAYIVVVYIIYFCLRTLYFFYMTLGTKIILNNSILIWFEHIVHNM
jgi:hypothetical protein